MKPAAFYNHLDDIALMFDKPACQQALANLNVQVPPALPGMECLEEVLTAMTQRGWSRVFIKPAHGSSASGVIAFYFDGKLMRAVTSMELLQQNGQLRVCNNLRLQTYTDLTEIKLLVDYLCREHAQVERWLPKASLAGRTFDLRIVVIAGVARHTLVRTSQTPITNLHLGNRCGDLELLQRKMGEAAWQEVLEVAECASRLVDKSLYVGVDVMLHSGFRNQTVLELNAFGDLLPGVQHLDMTTHEAEVQAIVARTLRDR
jgi:hypothetical protein